MLLLSFYSTQFCLDLYWLMWNEICQIETLCDCTELRNKMHAKMLVFDSLDSRLYILHKYIVGTAPPKMWNTPTPFWKTGVHFTNHLCCVVCSCSGGSAYWKIWCLFIVFLSQKQLSRELGTQGRNDDITKMIPARYEFLRLQRYIIFSSKHYS